MLLGGAEDMSGIALRNSQPLKGTPNKETGFGRVNLQRSLPLAGAEGGFSMQVRTQVLLAHPSTVSGNPVTL